MSVGACLLLLSGCSTQPMAPGTAPCSLGPTRPREFCIICAMHVKGRTLEDLQRALAAAQTCLTIDVEPLGFRLFDLPQAGLAYDAAKEELQVLLNGATCARQHARLTGAVARVGICALDCFHFFDVDTATGIARRQARYEVDYVLSAKPGPPFDTWRDIRLLINEKPADWAGFTGRGLRFDWLPPTVKVTIEGTDAAGHRMREERSSVNETLQALRGACLN